MPFNKNSYLSILIILILFLFSNELFCQQKEGYSDIKDAILSTRILRGSPGPRNVDWIDNGNQYSYTVRNDSTMHKEIREFDPATLNDKLLLDVDNLTFPSSGEKFNYKSFKWAKDSKHIMFQTNFRPIYRRSGISDYYIYSLKDKTLKLGAKDARTAELSPDGSMMGYEREGNIIRVTTREKQGQENLVTEVFTPEGH